MVAPLTSAPPPSHTVAVFVLILSLFVAHLPSWENIDEIAVVETFTHVVFPHVIDVYTLLYVRLAIALVIAFVSLYLVFLLDGGWEQTTSYLPGSKLIMTPNRLSGLQTMFPFTSWAWNLLGLSFGLNTYIGFAATAGYSVSPWLLRSAVILWEISAPFTLLVAAVVRYAIWPGVLRANGQTKELKSWRNKLMHNGNVLFAVLEVAVLGGLPLRWSHFTLAPIVGCVYVVFSWCMVTSWNTPDHGPQFIYFFFDTTLPGNTPTFVLLVLALVMTIFYAIFCGCQSFLSGDSLLVHLLFCGVVCGGVMRFSD
jgi:hypothetical protein